MVVGGRVRSRLAVGRQDSAVDLSHSKPERPYIYGSLSRSELSADISSSRTRRL